MRNTFLPTVFCRFDSLLIGLNKNCHPTATGWRFSIAMVNSFKIFNMFRSLTLINHPFSH